MVPNGPKCSQIIPNDPKWSQKVYNGPKLSKMILDGPKLAQKVFNGLKRLNMFHDIKGLKMSVVARICVLVFFLSVYGRVPKFKSAKV